MRNIPALARREMTSVFFSPLGYVLLTIFLFFSGFFFFALYAESLKASMNDMVEVIVFLFLVAAPFLTMRLLSEEYRSGTIETLMTAPVTDAEIVLAKFAGVTAFFLFMLAPTLVYVAILANLGEPDLGPVVSAYIGIVLMGMQFLALGLFCSALTRSQIVAGVATLILLLLIWLMGEFAATMTGRLGAVLRYAGTMNHLRAFTKGTIAFRSLFYFVSTTCFWLFLAVRALESRRWRQTGP